MSQNIYFRKDEKFDIPEESVGKYILQTLKKRPSDESLVIDGSSDNVLTCGKLIERSIKFSKVLKTCGIKSDDVISLICENDITFCTIFLGALLNGVIFNPMNSSYYPAEIKHMLCLTKPKLVLCSSNCLENLLQVLPDLDFVEHVITIGSLSESTQHKYKSLEDILKTAEVDIENFTPENNFDPSQKGAVILTSSGTTGLPKGVLLTHLNLRQVIGYMGDEDGIHANNCISLMTVPCFHIYGVAVLLSVLGNNLKTVLMKKFVPDLFLKYIEKYQISQLFAVPSLLLFLIQNPLVKNYDLSSLNDITVGAAPVAPELHKQFREKFPNVTVREFYGTTELAGAVTASTLKISKKNSAGVLIPGMSAKVCSVDTNENLGPLKLGELCFKGKQLMKKYVNNEKATKEAIDEDGFIHSGDLGYCDEEGFFFIVDRIKDLIKYKGFQVPPAELESLVLSHPAVKECGVVGIPEERAGELPTAFVVKKPNAHVSEKDIVDFVAERISAQKRLYGGVKFVEEIPKNSNGKILRRQLREYLKNDVVA